MNIMKSILFLSIIGSPFLFGADMQTMNQDKQHKLNGVAVMSAGDTKEYCDEGGPIDDKTALLNARFNAWKEEPAQQFNKNENEAEIATAFIERIVFTGVNPYCSSQPMERAIKLAQKICPSYAYWKEYYRVFCKIRRSGGWYTHKYMIQCILGPTVTEVIRFKTLLAVLKQENVDAIQLMPDWEHEIESDGFLRPTLVSRVLSPKQQELDKLKEEFSQLCTSENIHDIFMKQQSVSRELVRLQAMKTRITANLALREASHTSNRESSLIQSIRSELDA